MAMFFVIFVLFCSVVVDAAPEYRVRSSTQSTWEKVSCSDQHETERLDYVREAKCGPPKEVFITLKPHAIHEEVNPSAVWVKRCQGICYDGHQCHPTKIRKRVVRIRIWNLKTEKDFCSTYEIEEHLECKCCNRRSCDGAHVFNPPKYEVESV